MVLLVSWVEPLIGDEVTAALGVVAQRAGRADLLVTLGPLSEDELAGGVAASLGALPDRALLEWVAAQTHGRPWLVQAVLGALVQAGMVTRGRFNGHPPTLDGPELAPARQRVSAELAALAAPHRPVLAAVIAGGDAQALTEIAVAAGAGWAALQAAGLAGPDGMAPLVCAAAMSSLSPAELAAGHQATAALLARRGVSPLVRAEHAWAGRAATEEAAQSFLEAGFEVLGSDPRAAAEWFDRAACTTAVRSPLALAGRGAQAEALVLQGEVAAGFELANYVLGRDEDEPHATAAVALASSRRSRWVDVAHWSARVSGHHGVSDMWWRWQALAALLVAGRRDQFEALLGEVDQPSPLTPVVAQLREAVLITRSGLGRDRAQLLEARRAGRSLISAQSLLRPPTVAALGPAELIAVTSLALGEPEGARLALHGEPRQSAQAGREAGSGSGGAAGRSGRPAGSGSGGGVGAGGSGAGGAGAGGPGVGGAGAGASGIGGLGVGGVGAGVGGIGGGLGGIGVGGSGGIGGIGGGGIGGIGVGGIGGIGVGGIGGSGIGGSGIGVGGAGAGVGGVARGGSRRQALTRWSVLRCGDTVRVSSAQTDGSAEAGSVSGPGAGGGSDLGGFHAAAAARAARTMGSGTAAVGPEGSDALGFGGSAEEVDELDAVALAVRAAIARRSGDVAAAAAVARQLTRLLSALEVDLLNLDAVTELLVLARRFAPPTVADEFDEAIASFLARLGSPPAWSARWHWARLEVAIASGVGTRGSAVTAAGPAGVADPGRDAGVDPGTVDGPEVSGPGFEALREPVRALVEIAAVLPGISVLADAAEVWVEVLTAVPDAARIDHAVRQLQVAGFVWEAAQLAGQAAIRVDDAVLAKSLLGQARSLRGGGQSSAANAAPAASAGRDDGAVTPAGLSDREVEVARLVLNGLTHKAIGATLYISPKTVEHHVAHIRQKLGATNRAEFLAALREDLATQV